MVPRADCHDFFAVKFLIDNFKVRRCVPVKRHVLPGATELWEKLREHA